MQRRSPLFLVALAAGAIVFAAACGGGDEQATLVRAQELATERAAVLEHARSVLDEREAALAHAETERDAALQIVREAETNLDRAEAELAKYASDEVLFKAVQRQLLEDRSLARGAVAARVEEREVTLSGRVVNEAARDRAIAIARAVPGVVAVHSRVEVREAPDVAAAAAPPAAAPSDEEAVTDTDLDPAQAGDAPDAATEDEEDATSEGDLFSHSESEDLVLPELYEQEEDEADAENF